jgi:transposase
MSRKRKQYSAEFKAKIALAAHRETETTAELAARHGLHPTQINQWKRQVLDNMGALFERGNGSKSQSAEQVDELHRVIGQLTVERDFLSRKLDR